jgi:hypothetical protein
VRYLRVSRRRATSGAVFAPASELVATVPYTSVLAASADGNRIVHAAYFDRDVAVGSSPIPELAVTPHRELDPRETPERIIESRSGTPENDQVCRFVAIPISAKPLCVRSYRDPDLGKRTRSAAVSQPRSRCGEELATSIEIQVSMKWPYRSPFGSPTDSLDEVEFRLLRKQIRHSHPAMKQIPPMGVTMPRLRMPDITSA